MTSYQYVVQPLHGGDGGTFGPFDSVETADRFINSGEISRHVSWTIKALITVKVTTVEKFEWR